MTKLYVIALLSMTVAICRALEVITEPKSSIVSEGQRNVNLLCKVPGGQPIDFCIVKVPGVRAPFASSDRLPAPVQGITFYGEGWSRGSCGVTLASIVPEYGGTFECTVSISGQSYKGSIDIVIEAVAPEPPVIEVSSNVDARDNEFDYGKPLIVRCISRGGWPGAKLSWYLDGTPITNELGAAFSETKDRRTTVQQFFRKPIAVEDNRKRLICRAEHGSYPNGYMETELPIKLRRSNSNDNEITSGDLKEGPIKPRPPQLLVSSDIKTNNGAFKIGSEMVANCVSSDGRPAATFLWFLDDVLIYEGLSTPYMSRSNKGTIETQQVLQRTVLESDNGKSLICKARHPTGVTETRLKIVTFR
ncbi:fasciclin-3-like isoform X2 [Topomyia yanbarensis]|uniref:fasciclin-3-like isoform X2 n=1 Tax=Topomyia yanbarensis TaxID=2498891 RepID=UPI00273CE865|nr:fasciclin-3-like isoform X2 [Topomyia yanbarensis]